MPWLPRRRVRHSAAVLLALVVCGSQGCFNQALIDDPEAAVIPSSDTIAVGAKRDIAIIGCRTRFTIGDALTPVITTAIFSSLGRIDAIAGLPEAFIPGCDPLGFSAANVTLVDGDAFHLSTEPDALRQFTLIADHPGEATLRATLDLGDGKTVSAEGHYTALETDHVKVTTRCTNEADAPSTGLAIVPDLLPVDTPVTFSLELFAGSTPLSGYGFYPVEGPGFTTLGDQGSGVTLQTAKTPGPVSLTSPSDPAFSLDLTLYDASLLDALALLTKDPPPYVGQHVTIRAFGLTDGKVPCVDDFERSLVIETPDTCSFALYGGSTMQSFGTVPFEVRGDADGLCRVRASIVGTSLSKTLEFTVFRGWEALDTPVAKTLLPRAIWGSGPSDVFVVGSEAGLDPETGKLSTDPANQVPTVAHFDGSSWTKIAPLPGVHVALLGVWGSGPSDVFIAGGGGTLAHYDGAAWTPMASGVNGTLAGLWGSGPGDVFAVGYDGTLLHYDGKGWSAQASGVTADLLSVWGSGKGDVFAVGTTPAALLRYDGSSWTSVLPKAIPPSAALHAIWGSGPSDVWAVGHETQLHFDGSTWSANSAESGSDPTAIWGSSAEDVFLAGRFQGAGSMRHFDGKAWTTMFFPFTVPLGALWGSGPDDVYGVYETGGIFHYQH